MRMKKTGIIEAAMKNRNIVILITVVLVAMGGVALLKMPRNEFPPFTIRTAVIVGVFPGATSSEVETQLTRTVENYIFGFQEVNKEKTYSQSKEGIMYMFVELNGDVKNADQFWSKLKHGLNELKMTLPSGVLALVANSDFGDTSAFLITLSSDTKSYKKMEDQLKKLEAECRKIPSVSKIKHYGQQKEKIYVNVEPEKLNEYNIKSLSLLASYQLNGMVNYAGELKDGKNILMVHMPPNFQSEKDLAQQIVYSDPRGNVVRLKDIATIDRRYADPDNYIKQNGKRTILLSLEMQPGNNIVSFGKDVDKVLTSFKKTCPNDIKVSKISEMPKYVKESVNDFMKEFLIAIIAVIIVIILLLPFRVASVAGVTIPISVLITLIFTYIAGLELNTVTLASLILVLGMIVDNSIVIIDNYIEKLDHGFSTWNAAIKSAQELFIPVITATLAILAAFFPLSYFMKGTAGEFVGPFPIVIGIALTVSVFVAVLLVPYLNYTFIKKGLKKNNTVNKKRSFLYYLQKWYDQSLETAFRYPKTVVGAGIVIVIAGFIIFPTLTIQLFPELERNQFAIEIFLPTGSSIESTAKVVDSMESVLMKDKRITNVTSFVGTSSPRFHTVYAPNMPAPNFGQILVNTVSNKATREVAYEYNKKYNDRFVNAHVKCKILALQKNRSGIEIRITSDSVKDIRLVESHIKSVLGKVEHITWVRTDWEDKQQNIKVNLDQDKANRMGYSKALVSTSIMAGLNGLPLTTIWEGDYPIDVTLTTENSSSKNIHTLENQYVTSPFTFSAIPLRSFATLTPEWTEGTIVHRNGVRTLTISVDNDMEVMTQSVFSKIKKQVNNLQLPVGTTISYGGDYETAMEEFPPVFVSLGVSVILIFFILLFQFKKVKVALLIMMTMILGIPGAFIGIKLMGFPASLTGLMGITTLCGIVVRNGIILIGYARELREKNRKMTVTEAALAAGKRRMRPIFLTSAAASVGVIPMIIGRSPLWGPLGTVICFGLLVSMVLTLYILPILYAWLLKENGSKGKYFKIPVEALLILTFFALPTFSGKTEAQTLTLEQCKKFALERNTQVKNSNLEIEASKQVKKSAFTNHFPKISATAMVFRFNDPLLDLKIPGGNLPVYDGNPANLGSATQFAYFPGMSFSVLDKVNAGAVTAVQPVFTGGRIFNGNKLARLGVEINKSRYVLAQNEVLLKVEEQYWLIVSLHEKMKTLNLVEQLLDTINNEANDAWHAGLINRNDVMKVAIKKSEMQINRIKLENGIKLATMAFCQNIGVQFDSAMILNDTLAVLKIPGEVFVNPDAALKNREEYKLLQESVKAEELQTRLKLGGYLPEVGVGVGALYYDYMDNGTANTMAFASVKIPISDWWDASHALKERKCKEQIARNNSQNNSELLMLQIQKTWNDLDEAYKQIGVAKEIIGQAEENLKINTDNYKAGIVNISDMLEAQAMLQQAKDQSIDAQTNYKVKLVTYLQVTGRYQ